MTNFNRKTAQPTTGKDTSKVRVKVDQGNNSISVEGDKEFVRDALNGFYKNRVFEQCLGVVYYCIWVFVVLKFDIAPAEVGSLLL